MKKILILTILIIISCNCKVKNNIKKEISKEDINELYSIYKIDSINSYYLVYLTKKNENYKIVSKKDSIYKCDKIKVGDKYSFNLVSILDKKINLNDYEFSSSNSLMVSCFYFEKNTKICKEESNGIYDLFETENLKGLCYISFKE